jgi:hypothetical protein
MVLVWADPTAVSLEPASLAHDNGAELLAPGLHLRRLAAAERAFGARQLPGPLPITSAS